MIKGFRFILGLMVIMILIVYMMHKNMMFPGVGLEKTNLTTSKPNHISVYRKGYITDKVALQNASMQTERNIFTGQDTNVQKLENDVAIPEAYNADVTIPEVHKTSIQSKRNKIPEVHHIVFLKVHKAGSTSMLNIFMKFGMSRDLNVMVPKTGNCLSEFTVLKPSQFLDYSKSGRYDILCCHVIYNKVAMAPYFPPNTKYIGIVRQPFHQFISAFLYYKNIFLIRYLINISGANPIAAYLEDPSKYEPLSPRTSFTNNRMSVDFGYPADQFGNTSYMHVYVEQLVSELDFVVVMEYFDESLLLMKRMLGWKLKDIVYVPRNAGKTNPFNFTAQDKERHQEWAKLDYILYERFLTLFIQKLKQQDKSFYDELDTFRSLQLQVSSFCKELKEEELLVSETRWNEQFTMTRQDCVYMLMKERSLVETVRQGYKTYEH